MNILIEKEELERKTTIEENNNNGKYDER